MCGALAIGWGLLVAAVLTPEALQRKDLLGNLVTNAVVEGYTIPTVYTLCYGAAMILGL